MKKGKKLNKEQGDRAWKLLNEGGDNTDTTIAKKIGYTRSRVSVYLKNKSKEVLDRIDARIAEEEKQKK